MIDARELRIGNWVSCMLEGKEHFVEMQAYDFTAYMLRPIDFFNPIPLTPELLERSGFTQSVDFACEWTKPVSVYGKLVVLIPQNWKTNPDYFLSVSWQGKDNQALLWTRLKHLHVLQNYVFAVTEGEELEIKL